MEKESSLQQFHSREPLSDQGYSDLLAILLPELPLSHIHNLCSRIVWHQGFIKIVAAFGMYNVRIHKLTDMTNSKPLSKFIKNWRTQKNSIQTKSAEIAIYMVQFIHSASACSTGPSVFLTCSKLPALLVPAPNYIFPFIPDLLFRN